MVTIGSDNSSVLTADFMWWCARLYSPEANFSKYYRSSSERVVHYFLLRRYFGVFPVDLIFH